MGRKRRLSLLGKRKAMPPCSTMNEVHRSSLDISPIIMPISQYRNTPYRFASHTDCFKVARTVCRFTADTFGNQIINEWFASKGIVRRDYPLEQALLCGKRGMGALEFGRPRQSTA